MEASRAEASPPEPPLLRDGDKPGGDFPIQATITKSSTGQSEAKATLGSESKEINKSTDKNDKKKPKKNGSRKAEREKTLLRFRSRLPESSSNQGLSLWPGHFMPRCSVIPSVTSESQVPRLSAAAGPAVAAVLDGTSSF